MEIETKRFLPIGTVVLLKGAVKPVMITSFCIIPAGKVYDKDGPVDKSTLTYFEYGACLYPEGLERTNKTFVFNHSQIDKILHMGYITKKHEDFSEALSEEASYIDTQKDNIIREKELTKVHVEIPNFI